MARKLRSKRGSAIYSHRKAIVEPVNGQIKEAKGLRRFSSRGLEKVDGEWSLIAATHNLRKLFRNRRSHQQPPELNQDPPKAIHSSRENRSCHTMRPGCPRHGGGQRGTGR